MFYLIKWGLKRGLSTKPSCKLDSLALGCTRLSPQHPHRPAHPHSVQNAHRPALQRPPTPRRPHAQRGVQLPGAGGFMECGARSENRQNLGKCICESLSRSLLHLNSGIYLLKRNFLEILHWASDGDWKKKICEHLSTAEQALREVLSLTDPDEPSILKRVKCQPCLTTSAKANPENGSRGTLFQNIFMFREPLFCPTIWINSCNPPGN